MHQATLSRLLADRNVVTTLGVELACDALDPIAFDENRSVNFDTDVSCVRHSGISVRFQGFAQLTMAHAAYCLQRQTAAEHRSTRSVLLVTLGAGTPVRNFSCHASLLLPHLDLFVSSL